MVSGVRIVFTDNEVACAPWVGGLCFLGREVCWDPALNTGYCLFCAGCGGKTESSLLSKVQGLLRDNF